MKRTVVLVGLVGVMGVEIAELKGCLFGLSLVSDRSTTSTLFLM